jgi:hypothetical protein
MKYYFIIPNLKRVISEEKVCVLPNVIGFMQSVTIVERDKQKVRNVKGINEKRVGCRLCLACNNGNCWHGLPSRYTFTQAVRVAKANLP